MENLNIWPILIATVVGMGVSALWYSPIVFGKEWMNAANISGSDIENATKKGMWKLYLSQTALMLVMFLVLGFIIVATGTYRAVDGAFLGFLLWLGFIATGEIGSMLWEKKPVKLVLIQAVGSLLTIIIGALIIGGWR